MFRPVIERPLPPHGNAADEERRFPPASCRREPGRRAEPRPWPGASLGRGSARERPRHLSGLSLAGCRGAVKARVLMAPVGHAAPHLSAGEPCGTRRAFITPAREGPESAGPPLALPSPRSAPVQGAAAANGGRRCAIAGCNPMRCEHTRPLPIGGTGRSRRCGKPSHARLHCLERRARRKVAASFSSSFNAS